MSYLMTFLAGTWIGSAIGIVIMCLLQINRISDEEDRNAETHR